MHMQHKSPDLHMSKGQKNLGSFIAEGRGKTFTTTRLGNFPSGKTDAQFFQYTGNANNGSAEGSSSKAMY